MILVFTIPALVEYGKLMEFVKSIDYGELKNFKENFCKNSDDETSVDGVYTDLKEHLITLPKMYLHLHRAGVLKLLWFGKPNCFKVAIGADGAPFGKDEEVTAWLLSFILAADNIASCYQNFLLCGANCSEGSKSISYAETIRQEISEIEKKSFEIDGERVTFEFELVPSDMKWLATMSGELNNAAHYFSSFRKVHNDGPPPTKSTRNGSLWTDSSETWHPWNYENRLADARKVEKFKTEKFTGLKPETRHQKLLTYMKKEGTCQEFEPILGRLIEKAYAEPLHNTNNAWQHFHTQLLKEAEAQSNYSKGSRLSELLEGMVIRKFIYTIKSIDATRLFKKLSKWFNGGSKGVFSYHFTGKETKHNFMKLVLSLCEEADKELANFRIHVFAFIGIQLREASSLYSRVHPPENYMNDLKASCQKYFNSVSLFLGNVTPTVWTVGYAIPYHAKLLFEKYSLGLGVNTM